VKVFTARESTAFFRLDRNRSPISVTEEMPAFHRPKLDEKRNG
jgi:hypothetical protein